MDGIPHPHWISTKHFADTGEMFGILVDTVPLDLLLDDEALWIALRMLMRREKT